MGKPSALAVYFYFLPSGSGADVIRMVSHVFFSSSSYRRL